MVAIAVIFAVFVGKSMTEFDKDVVAKESYEEGYEEGVVHIDDTTEREINEGRETTIRKLAGKSLYGKEQRREKRL
jgi:hypothetical protein